MSENARRPATTRKREAEIVIWRRGTRGKEDCQGASVQIETNVRRQRHPSQISTNHAQANPRKSLELLKTIKNSFLSLNQYHLNSQEGHLILISSSGKVIPTILAHVFATFSQLSRRQWPLQKTSLSTMSSLSIDLQVPCGSTASARYDSCLSRAVASGVRMQIVRYG